MYIGIDLGTTACKTVMYDEKGNVLAGYESEYPLISRSGGVFQDANDWWEQVCLGIRGVVGDSGENTVDGISVSTQGISFVPTDDYGNALSLAVSWLDTRAGTECEELVSHFGRDRIHKITGKIAQPSYTLPMLMLFKKEHPDIFDAAERFCLPLDYINLRLTGVHAADYTIAGGMMAFDLQSREYSAELLDFAEIPVCKLPEIGCMGKYIGSVLPEVAEMLGITGAMRVYLGGQDQKLAALGAGVEDGAMTVSIGTATAVTKLLESIPDAPDQSFFVFNDDCCSSEGVVPTSGSALKWVANTFLGGAPYRELDRLAEQAGTSAGVCFSPDFTSGAALSGLTLGTTPGNIVYALYEGVSRDIAAAVAKMGGAKLLKLFGGGSRSKIWCRILADISGIPVAICDTPQTACRGAAILASQGEIAPSEIITLFQPRG